MATNLGGSVIQLSLRGDTLTRWAEFNPVLGERELVLETDTRRFKIGDGALSYLDLPYAGIASNYAASTVMAGDNIDLSAGDLFKKTVTAATVLAVSNAAPTGFVSRFTLHLSNGGSQALTWFSGIRWPGGVAPALTVAGVDRLGFESDDGGVTWHAQVLSLDSKAVL
jgi:hypothetical protein